MNPLVRSCAGLAAWAAWVMACDDTPDAPSKSRVQAVLAEPGSAEQAPQVKVTPEPAAKAKPRAALCEGQLDDKPRAFDPKRMPAQLSVDGDTQLAADPLKKGGDRWRWVNFWA